MMFGPSDTLPGWFGLTTLCTLGALLAGLVVVLGIDVGGPGDIGVVVIVYLLTALSMLLSTTWGSWHTLSVATSAPLRRFAQATLVLPSALYMVVLARVFRTDAPALVLGYVLIAGACFVWMRARARALLNPPKTDAKGRRLRVLVGANLSGVLITLLLTMLALAEMAEPLWYAVFLGGHALLHALLLVELPYRVVRDARHH